METVAIHPAGSGSVLCCQHHNNAAWCVIGFGERNRVRERRW